MTTIQKRMAAARRMRGVSAVLGPGLTRCYVAFVTLRRGSLSPTYREVADHLGIQINAVAKHARTLERAGLLTHEPGRVRTFVPAHNSYTPVASSPPAITTEEFDVRTEAPVVRTGQLGDSPDR